MSGCWSRAGSLGALLGHTWGAAACPVPASSSRARCSAPTTAGAGPAEHGGCETPKWSCACTPGWRSCPGWTRGCRTLIKQAQKLLTSETSCPSDRCGGAALRVRNNPGTARDSLCPNPAATNHRPLAQPRTSTGQAITRGGSKSPGAPGACICLFPGCRMALLLLLLFLSPGMVR